MKVTCRICGKCIEVNRMCPQKLLTHYRLYHGCNYVPKTECCTNPPTEPCETQCCPKRSIVNSCSRAFFKRSVARWKPGKTKLYCPCCCKKVTPLIKSEYPHDSIFTSAFWSSCLFPCLFPKSQQENVYCCHCNSYLGTYDPCGQCVQPNF